MKKDVSPVVIKFSEVAAAWGPQNFSIFRNPAKIAKNLT